VEVAMLIERLIIFDFLKWDKSEVYNMGKKNKKVDQNPDQSEGQTDDSSQLYMKYWEENNKIKMAASELYDKYLLTLSSGFLGGVLALINMLLQGGKALDPMENPLDYTFAKLALISFGLTIILTLISLLLSFIAIDKAEKVAKRYYIDNDDSALDEKNRYQLTIKAMRWVTFLTFISGIILIAIFTFINL
jgi:uncharacterized membrane protein